MKPCDAFSVDDDDGDNDYDDDDDDNNNNNNRQEIWLEDVGIRVFSLLYKVYPGCGASFLGGKAVNA